MSMNASITINARRRWWLMPLLRAVGIASGLTGWRPSDAALSSWVRRGVCIEVAS